MNTINTVRCAVLTVLLAAPWSTHAQDFGRVFSSPQERVYLDRLRRETFAELTEAQRIQALQATREEVVPEIVEEIPTLIHMGGSVRKADGSYTVWINGLPVDQDRLPGHIRLEIERGLGVLIVSTGNDSVRVRPGQTLNANTGEVREDYQLTEAQVESIRGEVARRNALNERVQAEPSGRSQADAPGDDDAAEEDKQQQELIEQLLDVLESVEAARDITDALP